MIKIREIAKKARRSCELYVENVDKYEDDHLDANCEKRLDCLCAIASAFLQRMLKNNKITAKIVTGKYKNEKHAWVETPGSGSF